MHMTDDLATLANKLTKYLNEHHSQMQKDATAEAGGYKVHVEWEVRPNDGLHAKADVHGEQLPKKGQDDSSLVSCKIRFDNPLAPSPNAIWRFCSIIPMTVGVLGPEGLRAPDPTFAGVIENGFQTCLEEACAKLTKPDKPDSG